MGEATVVAKHYFNGPDNHLLIANRSFGNRKYIQVNMNRLSSGKNRAHGGQNHWIHPEDSLLHGTIVYHLKFLGRVEVELPKGSAMVKEAIRKMKFNKQIRKAEGEKLQKVELVISVDGIRIEESRHKAIQHQYPLHRISYCADDKADKRMFSFIAKEADSNVHNCFVFDSEKCAEAICLTVGQAFDLAYRRFKQAGHNILNKQYTLLQKKVQQLTSENLELKEKLADLERLVDPGVLQRHRGSSEPVVGRKLENLILDNHQVEPQANGLSRPSTHSPGAMPILTPPPPVPSRASMPMTPPPLQSPSQNRTTTDLDLFGAAPFQAAVTTPTTPLRNPFAAADAFGMAAFSPAPPDLDRQIQTGNQELLDLQTGFSQGLSFGTDDFSLDDLDPKKKKVPTATLR